MMNGQNPIYVISFTSRPVEKPESQDEIRKEMEESE